MKTAKMRRTLAVVGLVALMAVMLSDVAACPSCKDAYEIGSKQSSIGESYSYSVVFFLGMFTTLLVGGTMFLRRQMLTAQRIRGEQAIDNI
ncbi:MAG: hypothetical protein ACKOAX_06010 [Candidatus Kapaibacterium sp.]